MRTLRAVTNTAMRLDETIPANPVAVIRLPTPKRREVDAIDLAAWWEATETLSPIRRDLHRAFMLTGARRSSLLQVRWHFNEDTNFGKMKRIPFRPLQEFLRDNGCKFAAKGVYPQPWSMSKEDQKLALALEVASEDAPDE